MNEPIFTQLTPIIYLLPVILWLYILLFAAQKLRLSTRQNKLVKILLVVLTLNALHSLFESFYFAAWYASLSYFLPISVQIYLSEPSNIFILKLFNPLIAIAIIIYLLRWTKIENETYNRSNDSLTNFYNKYYFDDVLINEINSPQTKKSFSFILIDIDTFKEVNETYGHDIGDSVIQFVISKINFNIRNSDSIIRWAGEEFLVILPSATSDTALSIADKIRTDVEESQNNLQANVTISAGITTKVDDEQFQETLKRADNAVREAKESGKNRVCVI